MQRLCAVLLVLLWSGDARAGTPITRFQSFSGNIDFTGTAGTLRSSSNSGNPCTVNSSGTSQLTGIPVGATVTAAYLYWAGSGTTIDSTVRLTANGSPGNVTASRTFTETFTLSGTTFTFFSGVADVTARVVAAGGNGTYALSQLTVATGNPWCASAAVVSGFSLVVFYQRAAEPFRILHLYDGFQFFRGSSLSIFVDNFLVPPSGIDGRLGHITWEGDSENSGALGGFTESLRFDGNTLSDALNPSNNQFNSTVNLTGSANTWGVDFDVYPVSSLLSPGQTSATSVYSSGADLVLLSAEVLSVTSTPLADLSIAKSHTGNFEVGVQDTWTIAVANSGPSSETGPISVTDTLPAGIGFAGSSGSGWLCGAVGQDVTCTHAGPLTAGASLPALNLSVLPDASAVPAVTNTADVSGVQLDPNAANDSDSDPTDVVGPELRVQKTSAVLNDPVNGPVNPKRIPGANVTYAIRVVNEGGGAVDADEIQIRDALPSDLELFVGDFASPGPVLFVDGAPSSGLSLDWGGLSDAGDDVEFDDGTAAFTYTPVPDADGYDAAVRAIRVRPSGAMNGSSGIDPSFSVVFQLRIR